MFAIAALGALVALAGCGGSEGKPAASTPAAQLPTVERVHVQVGDATVKAEVADDSLERARGLSGRPRLGPDEGMLFLLPDDAPTFWMKGMRFGLDIVWIRGRRVVDVTGRIPAPRSGTPDSRLKTYSPSRAANNALEVRAGWAARNRVGVGDLVRVQDIP
jgi:uncharacterized membrane protein (UPF0127 family)